MGSVATAPFLQCLAMVQSLQHELQAVMALVPTVLLVPEPVLLLLVCPSR
jgi:hypothetical protein